jgi:hypothetical protein
LYKTLVLVAIAASATIYVNPIGLFAISPNPSGWPMHRAEQLRKILSTRGLSLYQVSKRSVELFGDSSPYYIPRNFYYGATLRSMSPSIYQLAALSRITNYRLCDWLAVFGFWLDDIPRLQLLLRPKRTVLLDSSIYDENAWIPWFVEKSNSTPPPIAPLRQILTRGSPKRARELLSLDVARFLYAKIGTEDSTAFPEIAAGSIVRIDTRRAADILSEAKGIPSSQIFLIEHGFELSCCHLQRSSEDGILILSTQSPFPGSELILGREVKIYGAVDAEIRLVNSNSGVSTSGTAPRSSQRSYAQDLHLPTTLKELIRVSRMRTGLSFRQASEASKRIAQTLRDRKYFASISTLSDYETLTALPRQVQKIITLSILFSIRFWDLLHAANVNFESEDGDALPDRLIPRPDPPQHLAAADIMTTDKHSGQVHFLSDLFSRWEEVPVTMINSLTGLSSKSFSLSDVFWVGGDQNPMHPFLARAIFVAISRYKRKPPQSTARALWDQPIYLLLMRDGSYICACCTVQQDQLVVYPYSTKPFTPRKFRNGIDVEVIGQVTAIVRSLAN